jgi:hypothetical protein
MLPEPKEKHMKKFAQTIIAIALTAAGAQAIAATSQEVKVFDHQDAGPVMTINPDNVSTNKTNFHQVDVCSNFVLDAIKFGLKGPMEAKELHQIPLDESLKASLIKTCIDTYNKVGIEGTEGLPPPQEWAKSKNSSRFIARTLIDKVMERAEIQQAQSDGPRMTVKPSNLSKDAEMELAGYERVGSFKTACISTSEKIAIKRSDAFRTFKALKVDECEIYKERGKDIPSVSIN